MRFDCSQMMRLRYGSAYTAVSTQAETESYPKPETLYLSTQNLQNFISHHSEPTWRILIYLLGLGLGFGLGLG
jgi:hypothetical protein